MPDPIAMNRPPTVITYVNIAHFIDHYAMLIFAAAVIVMGPAFRLGYARTAALRDAGLRRLRRRLARHRLARRPSGAAAT